MDSFCKKVDTGVFCWLITLQRLGSGFSCRLDTALNWFKEGFVFCFFSTVCCKALTGFRAVTFRHSVILVCTFYAMSHFITQCSLPYLRGLFSSPTPYFGSLIESLPMCCLLYGCLSTRNSLSVNLDSRALFPFPNKLQNGRDLQSLKTQRFLGPPWHLTSTLWSQFNIWPSGCFWNMWLITLHWLLNYCLFLLLCSELFGSLDRLTVTDLQIWLIFFFTPTSLQTEAFPQSFLRLNTSVFSRALSVTMWKQSGKNTLPVPWAALFTKPISSQRYALTPLDPQKSTSHWSEKLVCESLCTSIKCPGIFCPAKQSSFSLSICN